MAGRTKKLQKDKPTKQEYDVAKFLRFNVPTKKATLHRMEVSCFFASAAVDALLDSQWSASKASDPLFVDRNSCVDFCHRLIEKGLFRRARQVKAKKKKADGDQSKKEAVKEAAEKEAAEKEDGGTGDELRERKRKKEKEEEAKPEKTVVDEGEEVKKEQKTEEKKEEKKDGEKKKKEKPLKLLMTDDQRFLDGEENVYVWIYDPASTKTLVIGSLIVFGTIAVCLFPLWPEEVHVVVYYCSLVGIVFVGSILGLAVVRFILFCMIWLLTLGRHHVWLFPNLTEDVGFFQSFQPLYMHSRVLRATKEEAGEAQAGARGQEAKTKAGAGHREDTDSDPEFEMVGRLDLEGDAQLGGEGGGGEDSEENGEEEEECGVEDEEYDEEEEDGANEGLEEEEGAEEEREKDGELKKDK